MFKNFKIKISYLLIGLFIGCLFPMQSIFADNLNNPIKLIINGQQIQCDVPPQNINGRVLVPARFVAEPLGAKVEWDNANRAVIVNSKVSQEQIQTPTQTQDNSMQNNNVKTNLPKEEPKPNIKNGLEHITINNIDYISLTSLSNLNYDKGYNFGYDSNSKTATLLYNPYSGHPIDKNEVLLKNIEIKIIQGKSYIEYSYYIENILPLIK